MPFATMHDGGQRCYFHLKKASMCEIIILPPGIQLSYFIRQYEKMKREKEKKKHNEERTLSHQFYPSFFCYLILLLQHPEHHFCLKTSEADLISC